MSEKYYRGLRNILNDTKYKLQLASMTLKINENKNSISGIKSDISGINNFSDKINNNSSNISSNKGLIDTNTSDISTNLGKINDNLSSISNNSGKIDSNTLNITEIKDDLSNINFNSGDKFSIEKFFMYNIEIDDNYNLNKDETSFSIFKYTLEDNFKKDSILEIDCRLLYRYNNYNHIGWLNHIFKLYDNNDNIIYEYKCLITNSGDNLKNDIKQNDLFYFKLNEDYENIKIELILSLINDANDNTVVICKLYNSYKSNFLNIKYYKKINLISVNNDLVDIENNILSNKNDISTNLIKINSNENGILTNLNEINSIKNNNSKSYLKNIYNILFYNDNKQINSGGIFYEKIFVIDSILDDFIEINLRMLLEYEDISQKKFVSIIYQILDGNNNLLYFSQINNNDYQYFSDKLSIIENIFFNFTQNIKSIKFQISFVKTAIQNIKILYITNNNYRFILKHYGN